MSFFTVRLADGVVEMLDQRLLPTEEKYIKLSTVDEVADSISDMAVRGAPAIGITAAMGVAVGLERAADADLASALDAACDRLRATRPTAVNLGWALDVMKADLGKLIAGGAPAGDVRRRAAELAQKIHDDDLDTCRAIGDAGAAVIPNGASLLTHCNAGGLATAGYGTALGVVRSAAREGRLERVLASETRPFLQGARLTAWELVQDDIPVSLITDGMGGALMSQGQIDVVVVGADRIAANGDVANKIGTYSLAVLADAHDIPFYVAAPLSTLDLDCPDGAAIPIEQRASEEVLSVLGRRIAPDGVTALHPAFDVTPARLITGIVTEMGVSRAPYGPALAALKRG